MWLRSAGVAAFGIFERQFRRAIHDENMTTTDGSVGIVATGKLNQAQMSAILNTLPEGTWELVCHPGYNDAELSCIRTRLRESRETELRILTSSEGHEVLTRSGVQLISYRDLV